MAIYQRIKAWERCHELCIAVYKATDLWPRLSDMVLGLRLAVPLIRLLQTSRRAVKKTVAGILQISELDELHRKAGGMTWLLYKSLLPRKVTAGRG
jgi:hypothetical protein